MDVATLDESHASTEEAQRGAEGPGHVDPGGRPRVRRG